MVGKSTLSVGCDSAVGPAWAAACGTDGGGAPRLRLASFAWCFFFQAEDGIRDWSVTGVQTCALPIFLENDTSTNSRSQVVDPNNVGVAFIQLIVPLPSGFGAFLGLNLPETFGLGIVLIAVVVFLFGLVKKARAPPLEPL